MGSTRLAGGYLLWPYPLDALENQQRFTFGDVNPATYAARKATVRRTSWSA
jgi:hypothetical protein